MLFSRTSNQQYVHLPKARPDDAASGEAPKSSIERRQLLENFLDLQVLELNGVTPPLYKFIDCKTLSRADCLQLSQWLEAAIGRNVNLLADMQKEEISFVPTLNLLGVCKGEDAASLFGQASARGLKFGVEVSQQISKSVAQELYVVMTCPQSPVVSFNEGTPWHVEASRLNKTLQNCIHDCTTLRYVGGSQNMLSLLDRSVPEIWLEGNFKELPQFQENLLRVLRAYP